MFDVIVLIIYAVLATLGFLSYFLVMRLFFWVGSLLKEKVKLSEIERKYNEN